MFINLRFFMVKKTSLGSKFDSLSWLEFAASILMHDQSLKCKAEMGFHVYNYIKCSWIKSSVVLRIALL